MLAPFAELLRFIWPFVRESMLQGGTFRDYIIRNKLALLWMAMLTVCLISILYLADVIIEMRHYETTAASSIERLSAENKELKEKLSTAEALVGNMQSRLAGLSSLETDLNIRNDWMARCGLLPDDNFRSNAACPHTECRQTNAGRNKPNDKKSRDDDRLKTIQDILKGK